MADENSKHAVFKFTHQDAEFQYHSKNKQLTQAGVTVQLDGMPLKVLAYLVRHPQQLIPYHELESAVWGHSRMDHGVVYQAVRKINQVLGDALNTTKVKGFIRSERGEGIELLADVHIQPVDGQAPIGHGQLQQTQNSAFTSSVDRIAMSHADQQNPPNSSRASSAEVGPSLKLAWVTDSSPSIQATAQTADLLQEEFKISKGRSKDGSFLLFDSEFIYLLLSNGAEVKKVLESSRILDANLSPCGRYIVASLGQAILLIDLATKDKFEIKRDLAHEEHWKAEHKETLENRNYWAYSPELIYQNVAISSAARLIAGSRVHYIPDGEGGYSMSEGFESVDLFDLHTGAFIESIDCFQPGTLVFTPDGKYLVFGRFGHGVSCYDTRRGRMIWQRWPEDNIDFDVARFIPPHSVLAAARYSGFHAGFKVGVFNLANGIEQVETLDHLEWSQKTISHLRGTCIDYLNDRVYFVLYDAKRGASLVRRLSPRLEEISSKWIGGQVHALYILSRDTALAVLEIHAARKLARISL